MIAPGRLESNETNSRAVAPAGGAACGGTPMQLRSPPCALSQLVQPTPGLIHSAIHSQTFPAIRGPRSVTSRLHDQHRALVRCRQSRCPEKPATRVAAVEEESSGERLRRHLQPFACAPPRVLRAWLSRRGARAAEGARLESVCTHKVPRVRIPPSPLVPARVALRPVIKPGTLTVTSAGRWAVVVRSCARERREPRQVRKEAAVPTVSLCRRVP